MYSITLDTERCQGDGACADICPERIFRMTEKRKPPQVRNAELCVLCGQCIAVCPNDALGHNRLDKAHFAKIEDRKPVTPEGLIQCMQQRRSVRAYKDKPIPRELLERVVGVAAYAPTSAHGGEGWVRSVAVVTGTEAMTRVRDLTAEYIRHIAKLLDSTMVKLVSRWKEAPRAGRKMLPDMLLRLAEHEAGRDVITYRAPAAVFVHTPRITPEAEANCHAPMMQILLAAHAAGLGGCWNGYLAMAASGAKVSSFTELRDMLAIPAHHDVYSAATLGYPRMKLHSVPQREATVRFID